MASCGGEAYFMSDLIAPVRKMTSQLGSEITPSKEHLLVLEFDVEGRLQSLTH